MYRQRENVRKPVEPRVSIYTPEWRNRLFLIGALPEPEQGYYRAFFAHLDAGWRIIRTLQVAAEALLFGHSPRDDVASWIDVEITDNYRWLAGACLDMIPGVQIFEEHSEPDGDSPFGPAPPVDELEFEAQVLARNVRLLAMMEGAAGFPHTLRGIVGPAASALTAWDLELPTLSAPVVQYVVARFPV